MDARRPEWVRAPHWPPRLPSRRRRAGGLVMRRPRPTDALRFILVLLALAPTRAWAAWPHDTHANVPVCTAVGDQNHAVACSDGAGGIIIAWRDNRSGTT